MPGTGNRVIAIILIALMAIGSVVMWLGVPLAWIYAVSRSANSLEPTMWAYLLILVGMSVSMVLMGRALGRLNHLYDRVTDATPTPRGKLPWHRSMRGERDAGHPRTVLDVVMVISVAVATACLAIWFFFFAGSPLPR